jgi:hypothetical protein
MCLKEQIVLNFIKMVSNPFNSSSAQVYNFPMEIILSRHKKKITSIIRIYWIYKIMLLIQSV